MEKKTMTNQLSLEVVAAFSKLICMLIANYKLQ
jgi:hypothetical protein